ncbi:MAG: YebC/PmpR family DNA-binding transcriptional regulator [Deltaproteobacteria bacterium]|nr:YebC/PmpR family DNA-binding transcriptional regulator [Deltaproteobacteria bacterium]
MSGHSKWSTIKRKKGAADAKRGKIFTRLIKEISVAARMGGGDPDGNPRLRTAIANAKAQNMPKENIDRAIKKGTGELEGVTYEEVTYEGYGPAGVAVMVEALTDNKNRTVSALRFIFNKYSGSLAASGSVGYLFSRQGLITFFKDEIDEDQLMEAALEAGADDIRDEGPIFEVLCGPAEMEATRQALEAGGLAPESAELAMVPSSMVAVEGKEAIGLMRLLEALEENEDVQNVWINCDLPDGLDLE